MPLEKNHALTGQMIFSNEDFSNDLENNIIYTHTADGKKIAFDLWSYPGFFQKHIQRKEISKDLVFVDGMRLDKFVQLFKKGDSIQNIEKFILEFTSYGLQQKMHELHNIHVNVFSLYTLALYVQEIINRRLVFLFKPTLKDTLYEIKAVGEIDSVAFNLTSDKKVCSSSPQLIKSIMALLEKENNEEMYFDKVIRAVDMYSKEYGQIEFVRYMAAFLHSYFDTKRHKNSYLSLTEQQIICFFLNFLGYTPGVVTESRYRQLFNSKFKPINNILQIRIPGILETNIAISVEFMPYSVWKDGRIDPLKQKRPKGNHRFTFNFGDKPELGLIFEVAKDMFD